MATVKPFKAIRPQKDKAELVAALPYDVYHREEAKEEIKQKPYSFLRVDRAETTLEDSVGTYDPTVYKKAKENLDNLLEKDILIEDKDEGFYLYELSQGEHSQTGLVAVTSVDEYLNKTIKKHENTRDEKVLDRINHINALSADTGPILLTYKNKKEIDKKVNDLKKNPPVYDFVSDDGVRHRVFEVKEKADILFFVEAFNNIDSFYIADGHHRAKSAVEVAKKYRNQNPDYSGKEPFNYFLSVIFPDNKLQILDYNRVIKDLNNLSEEEFFNKVKKDFIVKESDHPVKPEEKGVFGMFLNGKWYKLTYKNKFPEDLISRLDVSLLNDKILDPILGIKDISKDTRIDFIGGVKGLEALEERVNKNMKVAFSVHPTDINELMEIADKNLLMPPKSTWFEPKLRSGLFIYKIS